MSKQSKSASPENRRKTGVNKLRGGHDPSIGKETQFRSGETGNPGGRPKNKPILEALREIIDSNPEIAREIAKSALTAASADVDWFVEVRDMLDGKPDGKSFGSLDDGVNLNLNITFKDPEQKGGR